MPVLGLLAYGERRRHGPPAPGSWLRAGAAGAFFAADVADRGCQKMRSALDLMPSWPAHGWLVTLALTSQVLGWLLIAIALPRLPASLTSIVLTVQPVGSVVLGIVLLGEEPGPLQLAGVVVIVAGIVVATRGRDQGAARAAT